MICHYAKLSQEALLHLRGPDARSFLQGQVTCDLRRLAPDTALPGLYCTPKGRVVCDFLLCEPPQDFLLLRLRRDIRASSAAVFAKYIVFSKAKLESEREDWQVLACWGPDAGRVLRDLLGSVPLVKYGASGGDGFIVVQMDEAGQQFECYFEQAAAAALESRLQDRMQPGTVPDWQALWLAGGIARIEATTSDAFIPQMLNYDLTGHISFNKGCYTGQEVVARMHYRGKPKRRLYRAEIPQAELRATPPVTAGDPLYSADSSQSPGNVVNRVATADGRLLLLVTSTPEGIDAGLHLSDANGPLLRTAAVPYPVPAK